MAVVKKAKKKKKKGKLGGRTSTSGGGKVTSSLRPFWSPKTPPCMKECPNQNPIREALKTVSRAEEFGKSHEEAFAEAWKLWVDKNPFPAVLGRVCPHPCETACNRNHVDEAVGINSFERYMGDFALEKGLSLPTYEETAAPGKKIAVIGAGPAGLSCAYQLGRIGYKVTVFEAFSDPGGMLRYGIPAYRLPRDILQKEIDRILELGVELKTETVIGKDIPYEDLKKEYDAIFVGLGAHKGRKLGVEGEDASNVFTGTEFLNLVNSGKSVEVGDNVVVIGGGDTAIDAARISRRLGAKVTILYRRTLQEMPAVEEEIEGAQEEETILEFLAAPVSIKKEGDRAVSMTCLRMELGEPDASGRRRPVPIEGSEFEVPTSTIIAAISQEPDFDGLEDLRAGPKEWVKADDYGKTEQDKVYAGGDVLNLGLVIIAINQGRKAAELIDANLREAELKPPEELPVITHDRMKLSFYEKKERKTAGTIPVEERLQDLDKEVALTLSQEDAAHEGARCMSCGQCFECGTCWQFCQDNAIVKPLQAGEGYKFKLEFCQGCKKCMEECPCGYIDMQ